LIVTAAHCNEARKVFTQCRSETRHRAFRSLFIKVIAVLRSLSSAVARGPTFGAEQLKGFVAERIRPRPARQSVRKVHVQAFYPPRHPTGGHLVPERLDRVARGEV
jgi:hypothetical protein